MTENKLSKKNQEVLEYPKSILADTLVDLYFWSDADFNEWTIGELIELVQKRLMR